MDDGDIGLKFITHDNFALAVSDFIRDSSSGRQLPVGLLCHREKNKCGAAPSNANMENLRLLRKRLGILDSFQFFEKEIL